MVPAGNQRPLGCFGSPDRANGSDEAVRELRGSDGEYKRPFTFIVLFFEEHKGPFLWLLIANLCELALIFWALRIFHLVFYGNDAPA